MLLLTDQHARSTPYIKQAYETPSVRAHLVNSAVVSIYSDYSGAAGESIHGAGCCLVYNREMYVFGSQLLHDYERGSNYGEMLAIAFGVNRLAELLEQLTLTGAPLPKSAVVYSDCHSIMKLMTIPSFTKAYYEEAKQAYLTACAQLSAKFPSIGVGVKYIGKHKKGNPLHRLAHNAAREAIGKG
ncbi:hypothetical protein [Paenibacillus sp. OV219]|uniref:hypothetical protein n=1 Tax=Paenibacillus sp. OV219 TaxID=1884377 RepID=UPI0008CC9B57|nr:hypothetical protein [Paenibacillus sp. OV219]SEO94166.1 hypothetical protein SAMN05518847_11343 [Paenibacillus sp. OV219]